MRVRCASCRLAQIAIFALAIAAAQDRAPVNGDGGPALQAYINGPAGVALDVEGNVYVVERVGRRIRRIDAKTEVITTVAGNGKGCCFEEGESADSVALRYPMAVSIDKDRNIYVADSISRIRRVDSKTGLMTTVLRQIMAFKGPDPGNFPYLPSREQIWGLAINSSDPKSALYVLSQTGQIYRILNGSMTTFFGEGQHGYDKRDPSLLHSPLGISVDASGNVLLADNGGCRILRVDAISKSLSTVAGTGECKAGVEGGPASLTTIHHPFAITVDAQGNVYFSDNSPSCVHRIDAQTMTIWSVPGTCETKPGKTGGPSSLAADNHGNLYFTLWGSNVVRRVDVRTGVVATVAGKGLSQDSSRKRIDAFFP